MYIHSIYWWNILNELTFKEDHLFLHIQFLERKIETSHHQLTLSRLGNFFCCFLLSSKKLLYTLTLAGHFMNLVIKYRFWTNNEESDRRSLGRRRSPDSCFDKSAAPPIPPWSHVLLHVNSYHSHMTIYEHFHLQFKWKYVKILIIYLFWIYMEIYEDFMLY